MAPLRGAGGLLRVLVPSWEEVPKEISKRKLTVLFGELVWVISSPNRIFVHCVRVNFYTHFWHRFGEASDNIFKEFWVIAGSILGSCCICFLQMLQKFKYVTFSNDMLCSKGAGPAFFALLLQTVWSLFLCCSLHCTFHDIRWFCFPKCPCWFYFSWIL